MDTPTRIDDSHLKLLQSGVVDNLKSDRFIVAEFQGIFSQVYEHLLEANLIANKPRWQLLTFTNYEFKLSSLHLCCLRKHAYNELERGGGVERLSSKYKSVLVDHFHIQNVIHMVNQ